MFLHYGAVSYGQSVFVFRQGSRHILDIYSLNNCVMMTMRKAVFAVLMLLPAAGVHAQTDGNASKGGSFLNRMVVDLSVGGGSKCDGVSPLEIGGNIGYRFVPSAYVFVHGGCLYGLYDEDGGRHYAKSQMLGGGLGCTLFKMDNMSLDLRGTVASSIGNADWKNVTYDAAMLARVGGKGLKLYIGLGFRHASSRTAGMGSYNGFYGTLGFGI